jgi:DNA polymerase-3 subunit epsilon
VETTGLRPTADRVIEVGIVRVEDGEIVATYNKLINPETYLPPQIQVLTGITGDQLENAPTFAEEKNTIYELMQDATFVAHNARFDYAFLKHEFARFELPFTSKLLCTARLSRLLYPRWKHHDLSTLIEKMDLTCTNRHRAYDDAHVLWQFYQRVIDEIKPSKLTTAFQKVMKRPSLPPNLNPGIIEQLPETSGVYEFYDENATLLYIGKAINIKSRVLSHFTNDHSSGKELSMCRQVANIKWTQTAGELGALLREANLVKTRYPIYNRQLRRNRQLILVKQTKTPNGYFTVSIEEASSITVDELGTIVGIFRSPRQAKDFLSYIQEKHSLCKKLLGLENTTRACFSYHLGTCRGACIGEEKTIIYNGRFLIAFSENKLKPWYFDKPIEIVERCSQTGKVEVFTIDKWCLLKYQTEDDEVEYPNYSFDLDTYKILTRYIKKQNSRLK